MKKQATYWILCATVLTAAALVLWLARRDRLFHAMEGEALPSRMSAVAERPANQTSPIRAHSSNSWSSLPASPPAPSAPLPRAARGPREPIPVEAYGLTQYRDVVLDRDPDFGTPHFVRRRSGFLSPPAPDATPEQVVSAFIKANARKFTLAPLDLRQPNARVHQDFETKHNGTRHVRWQQQKDGLDIYGATFSMNLTHDNQIINVSSRALHLPEVRFHDTVKITAEESVRVAAEHLKAEPSTLNIQRPAQTTWYPLDMLSVVKAWDILAAAGSETHRLIVRADTGAVVVDYNCTWSLEPITLQVYTNDSPTPFSPGMDAPTNYVPPTVTQAIFSITALDTNASPQGWIPDGGNESVGNNVDAYNDQLDDNVAESYDRVDGFPFYRDFTGGGPATWSIMQAFYWGNVFHDRLYQFGFDEAAGNFQHDNFGRGGRDTDRMRVEIWNGRYAPPYGQYNQANITVLNDGNQPRMQLYMFNYTGSDRDSALDAEVVLHESAHGVSTRLIGDGYGLSTVQSRGMGEGWSDFMALSLLSEPGDDAHGVYAFGAYVNAHSGWSNNYYYGIRRFPYCTDINKAPQTLADTDPNQLSFPPSVPINPYVTTLEADQVHRVGEIWCLALWASRANLIDGYGFAGNDTMLQLVIDGMKLTPVDPTFTQARDAILQADLVNNGGTNQLALWRGFAKRGLGYSTTVPESHSTVGIQEAFDLPFVIDVQVSEVGGDADSYVEPGEDGEMVIVLTSHDMDLTNVTASLALLSSNVTLTVSNSVLDAVEPGGSATSAPPFAFTVDPVFPGFTDAQFILRIESDKGWFEEPILVRIGNPYDYPPEILDVAVTDVTETNAWVSWTTGIPADGLVQYGVTTNYGVSTPLDPVMRTNHAAELSGLTKGTEYHYRIVSEGTNGLVAISGDHTFRTRARIYVNANSAATQELGTIEAPFKTLQAAAEDAKATGDDILVAWGTYTGTSSEGVLYLVGSGYNLTILGGYSSDFTACNPEAYVTVVDGEKQRRGIWLDNGATLAISGITITRGKHEHGGGVGVRKSVFTADDCIISGNASTNGSNEVGGGAYATLGSQITLTICDVVQNSAGEGGGIMAVSEGTDVLIRQCTVLGNRIDFSGSGVALLLGAEATIEQTIIAHNSSAEGSGAGLSIGPFCGASVESSTIASNRIILANEPEYDGGGGIAIAASSSGPAYLDIRNSIVFGNDAVLGRDVKIRDYGNQYAKVHADYSCIGDIYGTLTSSNHLIRTDPLFANPAAGDFHILYGSPCIDTGQPGYGGGTDMDGEPRPFGAAIDIGADEFTDTDADHMADYWELARFGILANSDGTADGDNDALDDFGEYMNQTDPHDADTDDDLAQDGWEVTNGYDPLNRDMDGDGMWDGWEAAHALDAFTNDAALNPDGDPHNNLQEFSADTDPHDSNSVLRFLFLGEQLGGTRLDWQGGRDAWQFLETSTDLLDPSGWKAIYALPSPTPITNAVIHFGVTNRTYFYRIRAER